MVKRNVCSEFDQLKEERKKASRILLERQNPKKTFESFTKANRQYLEYEIERCNTILALSCDIYWDYYPETATTIFSEAYAEITGWNKLVYSGHNEINELIHSDDLDNFMNGIMSVISGSAESFNYELRWKCKSGKYLWVNTRCLGLKKLDGKLDYILGITNNMTEFRLQQMVLYEEQLKNQLLVRSSIDYIWEYDTTEKVFLLSPELAEEFGIPDESITLNDLRNDPKRYKIIETFLTTSQNLCVGNSVKKSLQIYNVSTNQTSWFDVAYFALRDIKGGVYKFIGTLRNIDEQMRLKEAVRIDALTGALSRRIAIEKLQQKFDSYFNENVNSWVMFADLDDFKKINDTYGHYAGDHVLQMVVHNIDCQLKNIGEIYRWGGEEFLIILENNCAKGEITRLANIIRASLQTMKIDWKNQNIDLTISIGISRFIASDQDSDKVVSRADLAMYKAKRCGKNMVCVELDEEN